MKFFEGYINESYVPMWQNAALFTDDGYNAKVLATMRRLFVVSDFVGNKYIFWG